MTRYPHETSHSTGDIWGNDTTTERIWRTWNLTHGVGRKVDAHYAERELVPSTMEGRYASAADATTGTRPITLPISIGGPDTQWAKSRSHRCYGSAVVATTGYTRINP